MTHYIEREAAIEAAIDAADEWDGGYNPHRAAQIRDGVNAIPVANVRPVEKCKWENLTRAGFASVEATCSACGKTLFYKSWWRFCPNCGAKVEKEQEDK